MFAVNRCREKNGMLLAGKYVKSMAIIVWEIRTAFQSIVRDKPAGPIMIVAHTIKGKGSALLENNSFTWHHKSPSVAELDIIMRELV